MDEKKQKLLVRGIAILGGIAGLAILLPIIYSAFLAGLGLLGIGIVGILGFGLFSALPMLGQKWENAILSARKSEARTNPIEQLQNTLLKRKEQIKVTEGALGRIGGIVKTMERMLDDEVHRDPDHDLAIPRKSLAAMQMFHATNMTKLQSAVQACKDYEKEIERKRFELTFVEAGKTAMASVEGAEGDAMQQLLTDEALKSVSEQFDKIFGELEVKSVLSQAEQIETTHTNLEELLKPKTVERNLG